MTPFCVGLTGGIASGKTSAAKRFEELGAAVVDTDAIAHELTRAGTPAMARISRDFGREYVTPDGSLDRAKMRRLVFGDPEAKAKLEAILHPMIRDQARAQIVAAQQPYVILIVPLLLETGAYRDLIQRVLVVDCSEEDQIARAMRRSGLEQHEVRAIIDRKSTRLNSIHMSESRMPSSA